ncbi:glycosyltransferase [Shewanella violacea]|uniref:Glycosyl transferase, group 1 family protein n=1 Tax=Shewanella violacea (strain JCM 10179 / CIP 106290 / LMG 19151 / DSS12) TaxID=637905 RepID=D4ZIN3_SHEVD|nr:glycosyltransferase [Shewanella violacea]BAJ01532.1 glycosyl transferase, group 1 family protein [Shewanella violacea DSS12]
MKILFVTPYIPYPLNCGTHQRVFNLLKAICNEHEVILFSLTHNDEEVTRGNELRSVLPLDQLYTRPIRLKPWRSLSERLFDPTPDTMHRWFDTEACHALQELIQSNAFELVHCIDTCMTQYFQVIDCQCPLVNDHSRVDSEFQLEQLPYLSGWKRRLSAIENILKTRVFERRLNTRFPLHVVCSTEDKNYLLRHLQATPPPLVLENGFDRHYFHPQQKPVNSHPTLVFTGTMDYPPNVDGMRWFMQKIWPLILAKLPNAKLLIVGTRPTAEVYSWQDGERVVVTGEVPDIRPYYAMADVYICPLRIGGGTRLKLVEALAMERPVVSTRVGAQGLALCDQQHICYADNASQFANSIFKTLEDLRFSLKISTQGAEFVRENYNWEHLARRLSRYYQENSNKIWSKAHEEETDSFYIY